MEKPVRGGGALALWVGVAGSLAAQRAAVVPEEVIKLVVKVAAFDPNGRQVRIGAGVVFAWDDTLVYIVTAAHTVRFREDDQPLNDPPKIFAAKVMFTAGDSLVAARVRNIDPAPLDIAVLGVPRRFTPGRGWVSSLSTDRIGNVDLLDNGVPVWPLGCPGGTCWTAPPEADHVMAADGNGILFQSGFVRTGSSGGALVNEWGEIVGIVTEVLGVVAKAVPIDVVKERLDSLRVPVLLTKRRVPRSGYRMTAGVSWLSPSPSPFDNDPDRDLPSVRVTLSRRFHPRLSWHVAFMQLGPPNLAVTSGNAGFSYLIPLDGERATLRAFIDAGLGHVQGRFDGGGYVVATPGGQRYVPSWNRVVGDGLGVGGGVTTEIIAVPHLIIEGTLGFWRFTTPAGAPPMRKGFIGFGIRWAGQ